MAVEEEKSRISKLVVSVRRQLVQNSVQVLVFLGVLALYLLLGVALWWILDWYIAPESIVPTSESDSTEGAKAAAAQATAKKDFFQALGLIMAGVAGAIGVYFTWRNLAQTRRSSERTLWLTEQGQITERFTRAIDQLGATDDKGKKKLEVRLGGIYALERIARDSERDHWSIMETLTTYVREHAPWPPKKGTQVTGFMPPPGIAQREQQASNEPDDPAAPEIPVPEPNIQAILTVLSRHPRYFGNGEAERLDLHLTDLRRGELREAHLEGADLGGAHLEGADLRGAHLEGARFFRSEEQIEQAIGDETTKLPEGLNHPSSWAIYAAEQEDENDQA